MANDTDPKVAQQFADNMKAAGEYAEEALGAFEKQLKVITQMRDAMEEVAKVMYALCQEDCKALNPEVWRKVTKEVLKSETALKNQTKATKQLDKTMKDLAKTFAVVAGGLSGLIQGFRNLFAIGKSVLGTIGGIADGLYEVGKSILSIPFKMLDGLYGMAAKGGSNEVRAELENIRENYGDLAGVSSRTVVGMAKSLDKFSFSGASALRIFGNFAERLKAAREFADSLGTSFDHFQQELTDPAAAEALMRYQRGLSFTAEQQAALGNLAMKQNTSLEKMYNDVTKQVLGMSKAFGITGKILGKEVGKAMQDLAHFSHLSGKEMGLAAAYALKLGVSIEKLTGMMDATKSYESTVENFSVINETFGTTIDYMKLMNFQNVGDKVDYMRKKFAETGRDMSSLSRAEIDLIKTHTQLDDATLNNIFSAKNQGVTMDKMRSQADRNAEAMLSQADAMKALATEMKQLVPSGQAIAGGVFDHLLEGFLRGVQGSKEFIGMMTNIKTVLREATMYGVQLGRKFVELFPGVSQVFEGIKELFDPARFRKLFGGIIDAFNVFSDKGSGKMEDFMKKLKDVFFNFFEEGKPANNKILDGFKKFAGAIITIFSELATMAIKKLVDIIPAITNWIKNPEIPTVSANSEWLKILAPLKDVFDLAKKELFPKLMELAEAIWDQLVKALTETKTGRRLIMGAIGVVFLPAIAGAIASAITAGVFKGIGTMIFSGLAKEVAGDKKGALDAASKVKEAAAAAGKAPSGAGAADKIAEALPGDDASKKIQAAEKSAINWKSVGLFLLGFAGAMAIGLAAFYVAIKVAQKFSLEDIGKGAIVFGAVALSMAPAAAMFMALSKIENVDFGNMAKTLGALGIAMSVGVVSFLLAAAIVAGIPISNETLMKTVGVVMAVAAVMIPMGLVVAEAAILGPLLTGAIGPAALGFAAMTVALFAMVPVAAGLLWAIEKAGDISKLKSAAELIDTMTTIFMKVGLVVIEAGVIGAAIVASLGVGALVIEKGFSTIEKAVNRIADTGIRVMEAISKIPGGDTQLKARVEMFSSIMSAIGGMVNAIGGILKGLDFGFFESEESKIAKIGSVNTLIKTLLNGKDGKGGLQGIATTIISGVTGGLANLSETQLKALPIIADVFKAVAGIASALSEAATGGKVASEIKDVTNSTIIQNITTSMPDVTKIIESLTSSAPDLVAKLIQLANTPGLSEKGFKGKVEVLGNLFDAFTKIVNVLKNATRDVQVQGMKEGDGPIQAIAQQSRFLYNVLQMLTGDYVFKTADGVTGVPFKDLVGLLNKLNIDSAAFAKGEQVAKTLENVKKIADSMSSMPASIGTIQSAYKAIGVEKIEVGDDGPVKANIKAIGTMVARAQQLNDALTGIPNMNFPAKLEALASGLGLGGKFNYSITSKDVVVNLQIDVHMDAVELEGVMLARRKSIIRDRINLALSGKEPDKKESGVLSLDRRDYVTKAADVG